MISNTQQENMELPYHKSTFWLDRKQYGITLYPNSQQKTAIESIKDIKKAQSVRKNKLIESKGDSQIFLSITFLKYGDPDRIRTCDPRLRRPLLYPTELRDPTPN